VPAPAPTAPSTSVGLGGGGGQSAGNGSQKYFGNSLAVLPESQQLSVTETTVERTAPAAGSAGTTAADPSTRPD
jgi:hypothetical protein